MKVINRYELTLRDDVPLALALKGSQEELIGNYQRRVGLSTVALTVIEAMVADQTMATGATDGVLRFVRAMTTVPDAIADAVERVAASARPLPIRRTAVRTLAAIDATGDRLRRVRVTAPAAEQREIDLGLIERQHRGTIERMLSALIADPTQLDAGETDFPFESSLEWISKINGEVYWDKLEQLRALSLQRGLSRVGGLITQTMFRINGLRLADLVDAQTPLAPADWRPVQRIRAAQYRQEATILAAQAAPHERVMQRLRRATTIRLFKIWSEGPNDTPAVEVFASKLPGNVGQDIKVQSIGGWGHILAPAWSAVGLTDGSDDQLVLLDGDGARDFSQPPKPWRRDALQAIRKMQAADIDCRILQRYALENYFPQSAYQAVMGLGVAAYFPLDPDRSVESQIPGYNKIMNKALAAHTTVVDLAGTDLGAILAEIAERAAD